MCFYFFPTLLVTLSAGPPLPCLHPKLFLKIFALFVWSQAKPSGASIPVHVHADLGRKLLYVANWGGGAFVV